MDMVQVMLEGEAGLHNEHVGFMYKKKEKKSIST